MDFDIDFQNTFIDRHQRPMSIERLHHHRCTLQTAALCTTVELPMGTKARENHIDSIIPQLSVGSSVHIPAAPACHSSTHLMLTFPNTQRDRSRCDWSVALSVPVHPQRMQEISPHDPCTVSAMQIFNNFKHFYTIVTLIAVFYTTLCVLMITSGFLILLPVVNPAILVKFTSTYRTRYSRPKSGMHDNICRRFHTTPYILHFPSPKRSENVQDCMQAYF